MHSVFGSCVLRISFFVEWWLFNMKNLQKKDLYRSTGWSPWYTFLEFVFVFQKANRGCGIARLEIRALKYRAHYQVAQKSMWQVSNEIGTTYQQCQRWLTVFNVCKLDVIQRVGHTLRPTQNPLLTHPGPKPIISGTHSRSRQIHMHILVSDAIS